MDVSLKDGTIVIDEKKQHVLIDDQIVCIYPEHQRNGVTLFFDDYKSLKDICI